MRKIVVAALALFITAGTACYAQVSLGVKAGVSITNFSGGDFDAVKKKANVGFHGGGYINIPVANIFSIQPELMVSTQGAKIDSVNASYNWNLTYITVPVMARFGSKNGFYFEAGPQFGFKISENIGGQTIDDFANDLDLGAALGLGFQSKGGLGIGARYIAGLSKVGDFESSSIDPDFKNSVIQVSLYLSLSGNK